MKRIAIGLMVLGVVAAFVYGFLAIAGDTERAVMYCALGILSVFVVAAAWFIGDTLLQ